MLPAHSLYKIKRERAGLIGCKHPTEAAFTTCARNNRAAALGWAVITIFEAMLCGGDLLYRGLQPTPSFPRLPS